MAGALMSTRGTMTVEQWLLARKVESAIAILSDTNPVTDHEARYRALKLLGGFTTAEIDAIAREEEEPAPIQLTNEEAERMWGER
jgi:hypothetical protein